MKNNVNVKKAFTLVELIVVITILAILWTIAFLSLQWYSADARNAKRDTDLTSLSNAMSTLLARSVSPLSLVANTGSNVTIGTTGIAWTWTTNDDYKAWTPNYSALEIKQSDFQDPSSNSDYPIWVTNKIGWKFEVAATVEDWTTKKAKVTWNWYVPRWTWSIDATSWSGTTVLTLWSSYVNKFFLRDTVLIWWTQTWVIESISLDLSKITLDDEATSTGIALAAPEQAGLIWSYTDGTAITDNSTTALPYE